MADAGEAYENSRRRVGVVGVGKADECRDDDGEDGNAWREREGDAGAVSGLWDGEVEKWLVDPLDLDGELGIDDDASEEDDWDGDVCV